MRLLIKLVAIVAALSVAGTIWFIAVMAQTFGPHALMASGALGILTLAGWGITLIAGPVAAVQLWKFRESGRRAGIFLFGYGLFYYVAGFLAFRSAQASAGLIIGAATFFGLPLGVLLSRRARMLFTV